MKNEDKKVFVLHRHMGGVRILTTIVFLIGYLLACFYSDYMMMVLFAGLAIKEGVSVDW